MKYMFLSLILSTSYYANAQFDMIEHLNLSSPKAEELFNFFKNDLGLTVNWDYQVWSDDFASGGLSFGNVPMEIQISKGTLQTSFMGICLEPHESLEQILPVLDSAKILLDNFRPFISTHQDGTKDTTLEIMNIRNVLPADINFIICDFKHRDQVHRNREEASYSLKINHGGNLGVILLKEVVIGCKNSSSCINELSKLPGIKMLDNNRFSFRSGPDLRVTNSDTEGILKIVVKVYSLASAKEYLESKNILGESKKSSISIDPKAIDGLIVELIDN